jgi:hypothetical protein
MLKSLFYVVLFTAVVGLAVCIFKLTATYSEGVRSGELTNLVPRICFKTWEGEISQGISGAQIFSIFCFR